MNPIREALCPRMAIIARGAVVLVARFPPMSIIHSLLIMFMTIEALEDFIVRWIHMTRRAGLPFAAMLA